MSADFETNIIFKATKEEYDKIGDFLDFCCEERHEQWNNQRDCWYLEGCFEGSCKTDKSTGKLKFEIDAAGPYGYFCPPISEDIDLFERLADTVPDCWFRGEISGTTTGTEESITAELKNGKLYMRSTFRDLWSGEGDEEDDEDSADDDQWEYTYDPKTGEYSRCDKKPIIHIID